MEDYYNHGTEGCRAGKVCISLDTIALKHLFLVGGIQDSYIVRLDLLQHLGAVVDISIWFRDRPKQLLLHRAA